MEVTNQLLEDAAFDLGSELARDFGEVRSLEGPRSCAAMAFAAGGLLKSALSRRVRGTALMPTI